MLVVCDLWTFSATCQFVPPPPGRFAPRRFATWTIRPLVNSPVGGFATKTTFRHLDHSPTHSGRFALYNAPVTEL